ncbi:MAG: methyltransferase domain-containing protein [Planctomycetes bacterium]|nr:methyltransferase domain-containing protein [Planctomycetota bacterium]
MTYYHGHEDAYRKLEADGASCWDRAEFDRFCLRSFLEHALERLDFGPPPWRALELGCGTGPAACFLAQRGFEVEGVDISPTAVRMAQDHARRLGLNARFSVADVLSLEGADRYDLILDGHCLHCIVFDPERAQVLQGVRRLLKPGGVLLVETMADAPAMRVAESSHLDAQGILWVPIRAGHPLGAVQVEGEWRLPTRRIKAAPELQREIEAAGLDLEWSGLVVQPEAEPGLFQAIARKPAAT